MSLAFNEDSWKSNEEIHLFGCYQINYFFNIIILKTLIYVALGVELLVIAQEEHKSLFQYNVLMKPNTNRSSIFIFLGL